MGTVPSQEGVRCACPRTSESGAAAFAFPFLALRVKTRGGKSAYSWRLTSALWLGRWLGDHCFDECDSGFASVGQNEPPTT